MLNYEAERFLFILCLSSLSGVCSEIRLNVTCVSGPKTTYLGASGIWKVPLEAQFQKSMTVKKFDQFCCQLLAIVQDSLSCSQINSHTTQMFVSDFEYWNRPLSAELHWFEDISMLESVCGHEIFAATWITSPKQFSQHHPRHASETWIGQIKRLSLLLQLLRCFQRSSNVNMLRCEEWFLLNISTSTNGIVYQGRASGN